MNNQDFLDQAAIAAMQAVLSNDEWYSLVKDHGIKTGEHSENAVARLSYKFASCMMQERARIMEEEENRCKARYGEVKPGAILYICNNPKPCPIHDKNEV